MASEDKNARKYSASPPAGGISAQIPRRLPSAESDRIIDKKCCERRSRLMDEFDDVVLQHVIISWGVIALLTQWRRLRGRKLSPLIPGPPGMRDPLVGHGKVRKNRYTARAKKGRDGKKPKKTGPDCTPPKGAAYNTPRRKIGIRLGTKRASPEEGT